MMYFGTCCREEEGFFYGVNLQGTNMLMLCARLGGKDKPISGLHREEISVPNGVLAGTSQVFFVVVLLSRSIGRFILHLNKISVN
jgi:hexokinase